MTGATSWGRQVVAVVPALVAGCAGAARQEPVGRPQPAASAASAAPVAVVATRKVEVGAFVPALPTSPPAGDGPVTSWVVRYGRGTLRMAVDRGAFGGSCRLRGGTMDVCAMYTVSTTGKEAGEDWRWSPEPPDARVSTPRRPPVSWDSLSPGRDAVYAFSGERGLDRIDERGEVTGWIAHEGLPDGAYGATVLDVGTRRFVLVSDGEKGQLAEAREGKPGEKATVGAWSDMPMLAVPPFRPSAQGIRQVTRAGDPDVPSAKRPMAMLGSPVAVALPAANEWALVWIEGVAPPYEWPAGKAWKSPRRGRHECSSGPPSRPLTDPSIDKVVHLTRMRDTQVVSDAVLRADSKIDPGHALQVRAVDRGVEVDGITYSLDGKVKGGKLTPSKAPTPSTLPLGRDENVQMVSFDARSGQGILVVQAGKDQWLRTFDATGAFVGEPRPMPTAIKAFFADPKQMPATLEGKGDDPLFWRSAARQGHRWVLTDSMGQLVFIVPEGAMLDMPGSLVGGQFVKVGDRPHLVNVVKGALIEAEVDLSVPRVGAPVRRGFESLPRQATAVVPVDDGGETAWLTISDESSGEHGWRLWKLRPGATAWQAVVGQRRTSEHHPMRLLKTWGGPVVSFLDDQERVRLRWLRTGEERDAGLGDGVFVNTDMPEQVDPFVPVGTEGQWGLVTPRPGPLAMGTPDLTMATRCSHAVATGPTTVVLACAEPLDPMRPDVEVGLRRLTLGR